jgi:hypothetical protein
MIEDAEKRVDKYGEMALKFARAARRWSEMDYTKSPTSSAASLDDVVSAIFGLATAVSQVAAEVALLNRSQGNKE